MDDIRRRRSWRWPRGARAGARAAILFGVVAAPYGSVAAQFGETASVEPLIPATNSLDPTAAGSEVRVRDRIVAQTGEQLLQESPGTRVVSQGGTAGFFCVRLRGVACDQITVMLGDVPISSPDTGSFDLSLVPLEGIDGFEVYRGGSPAWLNEGAVGGVLRLLPRTYEENEVGARATAGSFGSWRTNLFGAASGKKVRLFGTAGAAGAQNDYPYLDDGGTRFDSADDVERKRQNADFAEGFGFANLVADTSESSRLDLVFLGVGRDRGEPGPGSSPALQARAKITRLIGSASWLQRKTGAHPYRLQVAANYDYGRNQLIDELNEIGLGGPQRTNDQTHAIFGRVAGSVEALPWLEITAIGSVRHQAFDPEDDLSRVPQPGSDRLSVAGTLETRFFGDIGPMRAELRPSVRLGWSRATIGQTSLPAESETSDMLPTYRLGAALAPLEWLSFRASISSGFKLPSILQLFGNGGTIVANPSLVPERSLAYDGAVTARGHAGIVSGTASVGAFSTRVEEMIRFRRTSQFTVIAENIDQGLNRGVEVELSGSVTEHWLLQAEMTWTQATDRVTGNQLPGQPEWVAFVQPEAHAGMLSKRVSDIMGFFQVSYIGESYADPANLVDIRARTVLATGLGVDMFESRLGLSARVDDLLDVRGDDLLGFPLAGRRYTGRVSYRQTW